MWVGEVGSESGGRTRMVGRTRMGKGSVVMSTWREERNVILSLAW